MQHQKHISKLGQWSATAISGNNILSSTLYVSGIAILFAGVFAPFIFLIVALVLYLYKAIYTEVVESLPINGGAYNCLLNGTSKTIAAIAGVTTLLSYIATSVISAKIAIEYVHTFITIPVILATLFILGFFAVLVISGIKDSAKLALGMFLFHIGSMVLFLLFALLHAMNSPSQLISNVFSTNILLTKQGGIFVALYLAFSASLLGVSGFESSANFVEQQKHGVFRKTLRNMLISIAIFNPLICFAVLNSMDYHSIVQAKDFLLADAAFIVGGPVLKTIIVVDAVLVLSGAIMAAYIGVSGLISRMAADGCMPNILTTKNKRGSYPLIILTFFILCSSILLITKGNVFTLAGVYTIAFLGVMSLFALGNLILKEARKELKRTYHAPIIFVILGFIATGIGIIGNIRIDANNLRYFELYFIPLFILVFSIIYQDHILQFIIPFFKRIPFIREPLEEYFEEVTDRRFVAFIHNNEKIYRILNYISRNETGRHITFVHCSCEEHKELGKGAKEIEAIINHLQDAGAFPNFSIKVLFIPIPFGPEAIDEVSKRLRIKKNRILIGSIHNFHPYDYASLGGVRVVF